jgi:predicted DNA-binding transcriptional regulator AlpA
MTTYLRFSDLQERGIVKHWLTLRRWIEREGFPPGILLGPNTRAWPETDVERWLESRPIERGDDA